MTGLARCWAVFLLVASGGGCMWSTGGDPIGGTGGAGAGGQGGGPAGAGGSGGGPPGAISVPGAWTNVTANLAGLASECGNLGLISAKPDRDMVIAGVATKGLWALVDGGSQWTPLGQDGGSAAVKNRVTAIVYDPANPDTFWEVGAYHTPGMFRTSNNGLSFVELPMTFHHDLVSIDFTDPARQTLLVGGHEQGNRLLRSGDGGATWTDIGPMVPDPGFSSAPHVIDARTHLVGTYASRTAGVFRTTDGGASWTRVYTGGVRSAPLVSSNGALYWLLEFDDGIIKSTDQGLTWTKLGGAGVISTSLPAIPTLLELPDQRLVSLGMKNLVLSADGGRTWRTLGPTFPFSPVGVTYSRFRRAFYVWYFLCGPAPLLVPPDGVQRLDFDYEMIK